MCVVGTLAAGLLVAVSYLVKDVVVVVDGTPVAVRGFAGQVADVLADAGVTVGLGDVVRPDLSADLADGSTIEVRHARPITLTLDGRTTTHLVTATNVRDALAELDVEAAAGSLSAPPGRPVPLSGMSLTAFTERRVYVVTGTTRLAARTTARTVRQVLRQERVVVRHGSMVRPPLGSFPKDGTVITVMPPRAVRVPWEVTRLDWQALANCVARGDPLAYNPDGPYYGMYQFSLPMWQAVGGVGLPSAWPEEEQTYRAQLLYQRVGGRWQTQWPNCGDHLFS
ncbi:ubiquitin-like domain-containing protein [Nonomuraea sp. NPDC049607]|uniref:resuscitation-promoting factor n=1 Tax=Nonomuraea sp. NPDC049607 TaxID=3154732 RepID=UPI00341DE833